jgi:hypothetical protein
MTIYRLAIPVNCFFVPIFASAALRNREQLASDNLLVIMHIR